MLSKIAIQDYLTFDDVLLLPDKLQVDSRKEVDLTADVLNTVSLKAPFISSNMASVTGVNLARNLMELGGSSIIHQFQGITEQLNQLMEITTGTTTPIFAATGIKDWQTRVPALIDHGMNRGLSAIILDVAYAWSDRTIEAIKAIKSSYPFMPLAVGNIATPEAALELIDAGADVLKVGIGPGAACTTRTRTGYGVPQLSAILNIAKRHKNVKIWADGGMETPGDIAKAIAAGAHAVVLGKMFAGCDESPAETVGNLKKYYGSASQTNNKNIGNTDPYIEGAEILIPKTGPLKDTFESLYKGLQSAVSYSGSKTLPEYRVKSRMIRVSSATVIENSVRGQIV